MDQVKGAASKYSRHDRQELYGLGHDTESQTIRSDELLLYIPILNYRNFYIFWIRVTITSQAFGENQMEFCVWIIYINIILITYFI